MFSRIRFSYVGVALLWLLTFAGCAEERGLGEGSLLLKIGVDESWRDIVVTRALPDEETLNKNCSIEVRTADGALIRQYESLELVPAELQLLSGNYKVIAKAGTSVAAAFDSPYYEGKQDFQISSGKSEVVDLSCGIQNTLVQINYTEGLKIKFETCQIKVFTSKGELAFDVENPDLTGYFMLPKGETELNWKLTGKTVEGIPYTKTGIVMNVAGGTKYTLEFDYSGADFTEGAAAIDIVVNETPLRKMEHSEVLYKCPDISGSGFDIKKKNYLNVNDSKDFIIEVRSNFFLESLNLNCLEFKSVAGLPLASFNILNLPDNLIQEIKNSGIGCTNEYDVQNNTSTAKLTIASSLIQKFTKKEGEYIIELTAKDSEGRYKKEKLQLTVSDAVIVTKENSYADIWTFSATVRAELNLNRYDPSDELSFDVWREEDEKDESKWKNKIIMPEDIVGYQVSVKFSGLEANTRYYYRAKAKSQQSESTTYSFVTGGYEQLPNSNFERWSKSGQAWLVYGSGDKQFWSSGNEGTATLAGNTTTNDNGSARLETITAVGNLAAGNLFSGTFGGIDLAAMSANLSFGKPFTYRPSKMKFEYKYHPAIVDGNTKSPELNKGDNDYAHVYIALCTWSSPLAVNPKKQLFNKDDSSVIAYGEFYTNKSTDDVTEGKLGNGFVTKTVTLNYRKADVKPTYILVVATSSKYGDYFAGAIGSVLWLDNLELVYE